MPKRTIILYSDTPIYSGHEIQGALAMEALVAAGDWEVVAFVDAENPRIIERVKGIEGVTLVLNQHRAVKLQSIANRFSGKTIAGIAAQFKLRQADLVVALQGDIERCSLGVLAANRAGIPCLSYIPNPHSLAMMKAKFGGLRDCFNRYLYNCPDRFIVLSESLGELLREQGSTRPYDIVYNGMDTGHLQADTEHRIEGLPEGKVILGHCGRVEFNQKRQDFILQQMPKLKARCHFLQIGDGADRERLAAMVVQMGLEEHVTMVPHLDPSQIYSSMDWLLLPSGYEGVPLVMLEALLCDVPVMGYDRDGMRDLLPEQWRFTDDTFLETCERLIDTDPSDQLLQLQEKIRAEMSVEDFKQGFVAACARALG